jgi:phosphomannomutase
MIPNVVVFDIDGTLAESKQAIGAPMAQLLSELLERTNVAVISGGAFLQFKTQVVDQLPPSTKLASLYILPTSGGALFTNEHSSWVAQYEENLTPEEAAAIRAVLEAAIQESGVIEHTAVTYGERIELRGPQVSLSALGQKAPPEEKRVWDPTHEKREALRDFAAARLPEFDVKIGGLTTIDITKKGVNKAYGLRKLSEALSIPIADMLYIGDELQKDGNDEVVKETGIKTRSVANPGETMQVIEELLGSA